MAEENYLTIKQASNFLKGSISINVEQTLLPRMPVNVSHLTIMS